jgi:RNA polymerase sigma factor (sigma-70 family)
MPPPEKDFSTNEEALLIKKVLHGDMNAYKTIILQNQRLVASVVFRMVQDKEDGEDLCQDIFLKAYEKLYTFRFQSKLSTWMANIAFNHCSNFIKKKKAFLFSELYKNKEVDEENMTGSYLAALTSSDKDPDEKVEHKELSLHLKRSIDRLSVIQKTILCLFHENEFSLDEISTITRIPVNTVKSHLFRARAILKNEMLKFIRH